MGVQLNLYMFKETHTKKTMPYPSFSPLTLPWIPSSASSVARQEREKKAAKVTS